MSKDDQPSAAVRGSALTDLLAQVGITRYALDKRAAAMFKTNSPTAAWLKSADVERLLAAAVAAERERCAKLCESVDLTALNEHPGWMIYTGRLCAGLAALIRGA